MGVYTSYVYVMYVPAHEVSLDTVPATSLRFPSYTFLCKMRLSLLVAAVVWLLGIDAFVVPSCSRVTPDVSSSQLWATPSREDILNARTDVLSAYRKKGRFAVEAPAVDTPTAVDTPAVPDMPDIPDMPPVVVDTAPTIIDTPPSLPDVTPVVVDTTPPVGLDEGQSPISAWRQMTGFFKMPEVEVKMPDIKDVKLPDLPNVKLPEIPVRPMGEGITFPGSGERVPTLLDFFRDSSVAPIRPEPLDTERIKSSFDIMSANLYDLTGLNLPAIVEFFKVAQYGAWYVAGSLFLAWQIQTKSQSASFERELKVAEQKAKEAAEAASLAAQGAAMAKKLATSSKANPTKVTSTESLLAQSKMDQMELEKVNRDESVSYGARVTNQIV